ncbi:MAG: MFS transporter [Anaerolineae bacterium]
MSLFNNLRWWFVERFIPFFSGPDPKHLRQRNIWRLYQDLIWLGFASAAATYINVYALRLGASKELIGLRTSIPSLIVVLLRIPAARWMERTADRKSLVVRALTAGRAFYLLLFLLPWLTNIPLLKQIPPASLLVWSVILMGVPSVLSAAGWDTFFADVVPPRRRARVVSMRSTMTHLMMLTVVPLMGYFLDWVAFPLNYQLLFLLAFIGAMISTWHVNQIKVRGAGELSKKPKALNFTEARQIVQSTPEFSALLLGTFIYQWGVSLASPLFSVYFVDVLGASDSWIGWRTTLASLGSIVAFRFWPRHVERQGERRILTLAAPMMALFPLLTGLSRSLTPNLFIILIPRLFGSAVMLARYNILLRVSPDDRRPTYIAIYAILNNIAAFIAPMVGVSLADAIGIRGVFFVAAGLRLVASLLYQRLPNPAPSTAPAGE